MTVIEAIDKLTETVARLDRQLAELQAGAAARAAPVGGRATATAPAPVMGRPLGRVSEIRMRAEYEAMERALSALGRKSPRDLSGSDLDVVCAAMVKAGAEVAEAEARRADRRRPRLAAARALLRKMNR